MHEKWCALLSIYVAYVLLAGFEKKKSEKNLLMPEAGFKIYAKITALPSLALLWGRATVMII